MRFNSFHYIFIFLPLVLALYRLNRNIFNRNIILIISSYTFYAWGNPYFALLLLSSSLVDFFIGKELHDCNARLEVSDEEIGTRKIIRKKKVLLICSLAFNLGLLAFFKYWDWLIDMLYMYILYDGQRLLFLIPFKHYINVPPGISFYTFQTLSYTIDIYRRQFSPKGGFFVYLTYVAFFPQLIAGPIERAKDLLPQLARFRKRVSSKVVESAFFLISWGLFKKVVFADNLGSLTDSCKDYITIIRPEDQATIVLPGVGFILVLAFAFQIYCDFSAYSDIARGTARLFGIRLRRNFLTPYFACNPSAFWKRWHISLSSWVRDYVYIPLGGNRCGNIRNVVNLLLTLFLMGLWHGAGRFFILWGIYHGLLLILYRVLPLDKYLVKIFGTLCGKIFAVLIMFSFTLYGWLIFWARSRKDFMQLSESFWGIRFFITNLDKIPDQFYALGYGLLLFTVPIIITELIGFAYKREFVDVYKFLGRRTKVALYFLMFYGALFFGVIKQDSDFIYFQF
jgi:alginate O-acetyltransferase complex protein AlgI